jgi:hypothetical protein
MIKHLFGATLTPNEAAKLIISDLGISNWWTWQEKSVLCDMTPLTQREIDLIDKACAKQAERVHKFLNLAPLHRRVVLERG